MALVVTNRLMTNVGAFFLRNARTLAKDAYKSKMANNYQIINGFILRASGRWTETQDPRPTLEKGLYIATVMDTPGYILFAGALNVPQLGGTLYALAAPVGIRDDFQKPGTDSSFEVLESSVFFSIPFPSRDSPSGKGISTDWFPALQQRDWFFGYSRMDVPLLDDFPDLRQWYLDDDQYFDYSCRVALLGSIISLFTAARSLKRENGIIKYGEVRTNYFYRNQYALDEQELPQQWKLFPRRLVPLSQSSPVSGRRRPSGPMMNGFAFIPASVSTVLEGTDIYCHTARTFRQYQEPWGSGQYRDFDRDGEQGLLVAIGEQKRSDYDPETGDSVFASTRSIRVIEPSDIAQEYLHPFPKMLEGNPETGKPELPNFGIFMNPTPAQAGGGFVVFSAYTTYQNRGDSSSENELSGDVWSLLTTLASGETVSLRADWAATGGEIATGVAGEFMQPWIVGATSIPGEGGATAHCLVWEQTYTRGTSIPIKGEWSVYSTSGGMPTRTVFEGGAPLFSLWMKLGPTKLDDTSFDIDHPISTAYYAGNNKIVTACVDYPPSDTRTIRSAIFDVVTGELSIGGEIAVTSNYLDKCIITVVQPFYTEVSSQTEIPAVLLASVVAHSRGNDGEGGKVYISIDGGESWREYVTDAGAQSGAFYVGNKYWKYDLTRALDGRTR
ncbi:hypothetical protein [Pseudomonas syringae]|uniref:hypothetical protein n=1 Tax=Pseudomonas syringae TaxID=317 RepID=UPI001F0F1B95|nr:hypothetical protein [Pseudomonas syringae]MCH5583108.1 hypothetical protein [Pseudomonas syringae pv. syringae]MCH5592793.1 hypothetical protein [Pseudomonas syringae pv. syringae]MDF5791044.1 hypothetical protein [Pseudomonas syringae pv. syringae]